MIMGFLTLSITMLSKVILVADPVTMPAHVLILTPLVVLKRVQFCTKMSDTLLSVLYLPKLPTLMPCPGPQVILVTVTFSQLWPIETQSSPVPMTLLEMLINVEVLRCIPSVLGLFPGAIMFMLVAVKL